MQEIFKISVPWKFRLESKFTTAYLQEWSNLWNWGYKISDMARTIKPTDTILWCPSGLFIVEFKMIDWDILHIWKDFEPSQLKSGRIISWLCNSAFAIVFSIKHQDYKVLNFKDIIEQKDYWNIEMKLF